MTRRLWIDHPFVVTGADGFVGQALVKRLLEMGAKVVPLDSNPSFETTVSVDIRDPKISDFIPENAIVIHLAALSTDQQCRENPERAVEVNVLGSLNLAEACRRKNASQMVFASSEWVYGDIDGDEIKSEISPIDLTKLTSVYAVTKAVSEAFLRSGLGPENSTILRFGIVYGPRDSSWSVVERLLFDVSEKDTVTVGSLRTGRRFIYVEDLVDGILASLGQKGVSTFNLSGDDLVTLGDIIQISDSLLLRKTVVIESNPEAWVQRNPSNAFAKQELEWNPTHHINQGMEKVAQYLGLLN
jgi:UDP-glucose 4-epimerase